MKRRKPEAGSKVVLPITPMLDMTFQLLFFFIINFHSAPSEGVMDTGLAATPAQGKQGDDVVNGPPHEPADLTVRVRTQPQTGDISALAVENNLAKDEYSAGPDLVAMEKFLREKRAALTNKDVVALQGDGELKIRNLILVSDVCRKAGFKDVNFVKPQDFRGVER
jgi:biopolymer transport protein ExbD